MANLAEFSLHWYQQISGLFLSKLVWSTNLAFFIPLLIADYDNLFTVNLV